MGYAQLVMMLIQMGMSMADAHKAAAKEMAAKQEMPSGEDPEMRAYLEDVGRQKKSFSTGTAFAQSLKDIKSSEALTDRGILQAAGGSPGLAITGLNRTHMSTGDAYGKIAEAGLQQENYLDSLYSNTLQNMSQRKLSLGMMKYQQDLGEAMDQKKKSNANLMAGGSLLAGGIDDLLGGGGGRFTNPDMIYR